MRRGLIWLWAGGALLVMASPAAANAGWAALALGLGLLVIMVITLAVETAVLRWATDAGGWRVFGVALLANVVSFVVGLYVYAFLLGHDAVIDALAPRLGGHDAGVLRALWIVAGGIVALGALLELGIAKALLSGPWRRGGAALLFVVNAAGSGIVLAEAIVPATYKRVTAAEAAHLKSAYEPEIAFMRETLVALREVWPEVAPVGVGGRVTERDLDAWVTTRAAQVAELRFVSLSLADATPRYRLHVRLSAEEWVLLSSGVRPWEEGDRRVDRAAARYTPQGDPVRIREETSYGYTLADDEFEARAVFAPPD